MNVAKSYLLILLYLTTTACQEHVTIVKFFANEEGHLIVPLLINDSVVYGVFDTGAPGSRITEFERKRIDLTKTSDSTWHLTPSISSDILHYMFQTIKTNVSLNRIVLKKPVEFSIFDMDSTYLSYIGTAWGNNIIDQLNWLFDFTNNDLTVSDKPIHFDTTDCIIIHYRDDQGYKICTLYSKELGLLDHIFIDSGHGWAVVKSADDTLNINPKRSAWTKTKGGGTGKYSIALMVPDPAQDERNSNLRRFEQYEQYKSDSIDFHLPFINVYDRNNISIYEGYIGYVKTYCIFDYMSINGLMNLCYATGYSYMYLDTYNKKIYLKK